MQTFGSITKVSLALLAATSVAHAHSWIEQVMVIAPNGTFVGEPGYPRGNIKRNEPGFGDPPMVHLINGGPGDAMCKDSQNSPSSQSASSPRVQAAAGADIALRFQENGHVTLPQGQIGKAENRGDIFVYGTTKPKDNELFTDVHGVWTADGKGGDGRGVLLVKAAYDDGQCYQVNGGAISVDRQKKFAHPSNSLMGADLWCQTDVRLPSDAPSGQPYTLYWVWEWPTAAGVDPGLPVGKNETYTTCLDADIIAAGDFSQKVATGGFVQDQPIENAAVPDQFSKLGEQPAAGPASPQSAPASAPSAPAPLAPAAAPSVAPAAAPAGPPAAPPGAPPIVPLAAPPGAPPTVPLAAPPGAPPPGPAPAPSASKPATSAPAPTTISPIPGPDTPTASARPSSASTPSAPAASAHAPSAPTSSASASPVSVASASTSASMVPLLAPPFPAPTAAVGTMLTVTTTDKIMFTTTDFVTVTPTSVPTSAAAPKMRGRNPVFHLGE